MAINKLTPTNLIGNLSTKISSAELTIQQGNVTRTPADLANLPRATTLRGEVQNQNSDGTTRIKTQRGSVDVKLETALPKGQKVDIQLSSGSPPRDAIVQTASPRARPSQPQTQTQPQQQVQAQPTSTQTAPTQTVQSQTPQSAQQAAPSQPSPAVQQGQTAPPNTALDSVKNLQTTAKQAIDALATSTKQSAAPAQQVNKGEKPQIQTPQATQTTPAPNLNTQIKPLQAGQAIRLTPLPAALQNPNGLAQLPNVAPSSTSQLTPSILQAPSISSSQILNIATLTTGTPTTNISFLQTSLSPFTPSLNGATIATATSSQNAGTQTLINALSQTPLTAKTSAPTLLKNLITTPQISLTSAATARTPQDARVLALRTPIFQSTPSPTAHNFTVNSVVTNPTTATAIANIQPSQILAQATGQTTTQGNPIVQIIPHATGTTAGGSPSPTFFALNYPATNLPKGTQIILQPTLTQNSAPIAPQAWPALAETFESLFPQLSQAQAQSLLNVIPRPAAAGHQFTATALLFIAAARGGEISGWMGARADQVIQGSSKKDMFTRLLSDIKSMTGRPASTDPQAPAAAQGSADWRGHTLPLLFGMDLSKIHLWTKPFGDDESENADPSRARGTRFIVDLELSHMGNVQLDGLVQPYAKRLDLALKTAHDFAPDVRQHLRETWHNALKSIDMTGQIDFQTS